jgi:tRNA nucleotidyltransferase (CCA-adding enzyme)
MQREECVSIRELAVDGRDLIALGYAPGPELGETLKQLLQLVLDDPARNTAEELKKRATELLVK